MTGAMMVESAHGLIATEHPADGSAAVVRSAHRTSLAAALRFESWRLMVPDGTRASLDGRLPELMVEIPGPDSAPASTRPTGTTDHRSLQTTPTFPLLQPMQFGSPSTSSRAERRPSPILPTRSG